MGRSLAYKAANLRRGARVADWGSLENCCACKRTVGSNPTLSARNANYGLDIPHKTIISICSVYAWVYTSKPD